MDTVDPRVVAFLADKCGYGVEVVPAGALRPRHAYRRDIQPAREDREDPNDELAIPPRTSRSTSPRGTILDDANESTSEAEADAKSRRSPERL